MKTKSATPLSGQDTAQVISHTQETVGPAECSINTAVSGTVLTESGKPIQGATVRLQTTSITTTTNATGQFHLCEISQTGTFRITAFAPGYYINEADTTSGASNITITLVAYNQIDNPDYEFLTAGTVSEGEGENTGCAKCHSASLEDISQGVTLPYDEWLLDAHAQSATNPRFLSMYNGADLLGNQSPITTYIAQKDYGLIPIKPNLDGNYFGPGFKLDFPHSTGNCASCHTATAAVNSPYDTDPNQITGVGLEGITCDFCHKVTAVSLDKNTGLPVSNMTGVLSIELKRPSGEHQLFLGPYDDVAPGEDTYSELQNTGQYCAACHSAEFWGVKIYNSYGEWLESDYSNPESEIYKTCQNCHMPSSGADHFVRLENGGLIREENTIFSHKMLGATDMEFLQNTASLDVTAKRDGNLIIVDVSVTNDNGGHDIPTDSPLRQILLSVKTNDAAGNQLPLRSGAILPDWTGDYAGLPGIYFAKILEELWTDVMPTGSYWMQTRLIEDTRLSAFETRTTEFIFEAPQNSSVTIDTSLTYRRAFYSLLQQKGWETPDILMEQNIITLK